MTNLGGTELKRLHRDWRRRTGQRVGLVLEGVQNPFNVGTIARTAAAFGVERVWAVGDVPAFGSAKVQKTALGTHRYLDRIDVAGIGEAAAAAHADGYTVVGLELAAGAEPIHELDLSGDVCVVAGHEDRGLSRDALGSCDRLAYLPQVGRVGSLNVATALSIALFEVRRQGWSAPS